MTIMGIIIVDFMAAGVLDCKGEPDKESVYLNYRMDCGETHTHTH